MHILYEKALFYKKRKNIEQPNGYVYDYVLGVWINVVDSAFLVYSENFKSLATKKFDVETGEDHKGQ